jgi:alcohol dehydrogenase (NADP+)
MPLNDYLSLLRTDGTLIQVGNPDDGLLAVPAPALIMRRATLAGSMIGSPGEIREMLQFAVDKKVTPRIQERPMKDANQAIVDMENGSARYRYVLVNEENI